MRATLKHPLVTSLAVVAAAAIAATAMAVTGGESASASGPNQITARIPERPLFAWRCGQIITTIPTTNYRQVRILGNWLRQENDASSEASLKFFVQGESGDEWQIGEMALAERSVKTTVIDIPGTSLVIRVACDGTAATVDTLFFGN